MLNMIIKDKYEDCIYNITLDDIDINNKKDIEDKIWYSIKRKYGVFVNDIIVNGDNVTCNFNRYIPNYNSSMIAYPPLIPNNKNEDGNNIEIPAKETPEDEPIEIPVPTPPKPIDSSIASIPLKSDLEYSYYTPEEVLKFDVEPVFGDLDMKEVATRIRDIYYHTYTIKDTDKVKLLALGWNYNIEPSVENMKKASDNTKERIHSKNLVKLDDTYFDKYINDDKIELEDEEEIDDIIEGFLNAKSKPAKNQKAHLKYLKDKMKKNINNKATSAVVNNVHHESIKALDDPLFTLLSETKTTTNKNPIFIVVSKTNTPAGKVIGAYTKEEYTHAGLSLEPSLKNMYSFNMSSKAGFSIENIDQIMKRANTKIKVLVMFVSDEAKKNIDKSLDFLKQNNDKTKYDLDIIWRTLFQKSKDFSEYSTGKLHFVCSEFVAYIIKMADIDLDMNKAINLVTPGDLGNIKHEKVYLLYEGPSEKYESKKIVRILRKLKEKSKLIKECILYEILN